MPSVIGSAQSQPCADVGPEAHAHTDTAATGAKRSAVVAMLNGLVAGSAAIGASLAGSETAFHFLSAVAAGAFFCAASMVLFQVLPAEGGA